MDSKEFQKLYEAEFAAPLIEHGFQMIGQGNSMRHVEGNRELLILRQGGRLSRPGLARSVICFRHTFLRPIESDDPTKAPIYVEDCPRKMVFDDFDGWFRSKIRYRPENSGRWQIHDISYSDVDPRSVIANLKRLRVTVTQRILPWVRTLTEVGELSQIKGFGENAWCEQRWIEDYEAFIAAQP